MQRSLIPYVFLGLSVILTGIALVFWWNRPRPVEGLPERPLVAVEEAPAPALEETPELPGNDIPPPPDDPATVQDELGVGLRTAEPAELVERVAQALEAGDPAALLRVIGDEAMDEATRERLLELAARPLKFRQPGGIREVGELELNRRLRWSLELEDAEPGRERIFLDLRKTEDGWVVDGVTLPPRPGETVPPLPLADPLGVADVFLQAVLRQDFERARQYVDSGAVSDAKIAGLCILFEEGGYKLRDHKPLRAMFQRGDTAGFLVNVETLEEAQHAQFALTLRQPEGREDWRVIEINLDQLLADYARRVAGGDLYYSPLVKNPAGGDTIALYFEFDEDAMNPRARRQLEIVSLILRSDPGRRITLSGHTDALGGDDYNHQLSSRRAEVVRDFLAESGVDPAQIVTLAKGASQPRRPNVTETGADDPEGRRANRRTEIYLDF